MNAKVSKKGGSARESRFDKRHAIKLVTSSLAEGAASLDAVIHNISSTGLLIETVSEVEEGRQLEVELPETGKVKATVVWRSGLLHGCEFESELNAAALAAAQLQSMPRKEPDGARSPWPHRASSETLGMHLFNLRRQSGMTLDAVASALNVSKPTVWAWEKGKAHPLPERLGDIADVFGVSVETLMNRPSTQETAVVIDQCRKRVADAYGAPPSAVRIMIEL